MRLTVGKTLYGYLRRLRIFGWGTRTRQCSALTPGGVRRFDSPRAETIAPIDPPIHVV